MIRQGVRICRYTVRIIPECCPDVTGNSVRILPKYAFDEEELLHSLLSIISLALYLESKHNIVFDNHIIPILKDFNEQLKSTEGELSLTTYNNIQIFCIFLKKVNLAEISEQLKKICDKKKINYDRTDPLYNFDIIKRPIITFENRLFVEFDKNILGRD